MGNIWDGPKPKLQNPKNRTLGNYIHAIAYDEPIDYHDKDRPKGSRNTQGKIQIVRRKKGIVTPQPNVVKSRKRAFGKDLQNEKRNTQNPRSRKMYRL